MKELSSSGLWTMPAELNSIPPKKSSPRKMAITAIHVRRIPLLIPTVSSAPSDRTPELSVKRTRHDRGGGSPYFRSIASHLRHFSKPAKFRGSAVTFDLLPVRQLDWHSVSASNRILLRVARGKRGFCDPGLTDHLLILYERVFEGVLSRGSAIHSIGSRFGMISGAISSSSH